MCVCKSKGENVCNTACRDPAVRRETEFKTLPVRKKLTNEGR